MMMRCCFVTADNVYSRRCFAARSVSARHDEAGMSDVNFLCGQLRTRRRRPPGGRGGAVRSALQEHGERVTTNARSGLGRGERDVNNLASGSRVDARRRWRRTSPGNVRSLDAQLQPVVGGQQSRTTRSVGEREAGGKTAVRWPLRGSVEGWVWPAAVAIEGATGVRVAVTAVPCSVVAVREAPTPTPLCARAFSA
jgi:hypothetical protein